MVTLNQISTEKLITVPLSHKVDEAMSIMRKYQIRHLPVANADEKIIGLVSDRDLLLNSGCDEKLVSDIMKTDLITFDIKAELKYVVESIIENKISAVLVTRGHHIVGIVTSEDLLNVLLKYLNADDSTPTFLEDYIEMFKSYLLEVKNPNYV